MVRPSRSCLGVPISYVTLIGLIFVNMIVPAYPQIGGLQQFQYCMYSAGNLSFRFSAIIRSSSILDSQQHNIIGLAFSKNSCTLFFLITARIPLTFQDQIVIFSQSISFYFQTKFRGFYIITLGTLYYIIFFVLAEFFKKLF